MNFNLSFELLIPFLMQEISSKLLSIKNKLLFSFKLKFELIPFFPLLTLYLFFL